MPHMIEDKDPNSPATTSFAWDRMIDVWDMVETLLGGTRTMRAAGTKYLPQHEEETSDNYRERLDTNTLFNMMELTLNSFVGRPFSDPVGLNEDVPDQIRDISRDIDLQGNDITTFAREWFRESIAKGFAHCLVEFPGLADEELENRTRADDMESGRRPYWLLVKPENLIFASAETVETPNGPQEFLTHVRIREQVIQRVGFSEIVVDQIRVLEPGSFQVWQLLKDDKNKPEWRIIEQGFTDLDFIPLVTFYTDRKDLMVAKPPLEDLAHLNIRHWQSTSDQVNILTVARFPMLAVSGATDQAGSVMRIGPRQLLGTKDPMGKFYYVEHDGKSIEAGEKDLQKLEDQMSSYGAEFLKRQPGNMTATGRALDSAESMSLLQDITVRFIDTMNTALDFTAQWMGLEEGGTVTVNTEFGPEEIEEPDVETLNSARKNRDISRVAYLTELKRRGVLAEDYDDVADLEVLLAEVEVLKPLAPLVPGTFDPSEESSGGSGDERKIVENAPRDGAESEGE